MHRPTAVLALAAFAAAVSAQPTDGDTRVEAIWAEQGVIYNPVAFTIDRFGRLFVVESYRAGNAVTDTRNLGHLNAVEEDLKLQSVEDRLALINKWIAQGAFEPDFFTRTDDRIVRVADTDGDGLADDKSVFADGFNDPLDGIAAGALWLGDTLYFTNIPHLWALRDTDGDGAADERESLAYGFGVRWCFYGHDLHGLVLGPDGRIYFSMGDRGFNVTTAEGEHLVNPQTGGVFRCWPDGSGLELFAQGLRNPQELCFDDYGNLFTGDNNCDSGDKARVVHVIEGADYGWRQDVQSLDSRGPWNREKIWHTFGDPKDIARPAWTMPPVAHVGAGPSGILHYPGTGENAAYDGHIFMVDFYGSGSTVHSFRMEPDGAWFSLENKGVYYKGKTVTDIAFGYDGRMYLSDWGGGWQPNENGNIFTITNTTVHENAEEAAAIDEVASLFADGFESLETDRLFRLLAHRDQRVRLAAQYELANPGRDAAGMAAEVAASSDREMNLLARVHAVWLLRQIARHDDGARPPLRDLLDDDDAQIRTQALKMLADLRDAEPAARYLELLADDHAPVRANAVLALGRIAHAPAAGPLLDLLDANDDRDPAIRHAASYALALINRPDDLVDAALARGEGARIGAVIALRRMHNLGLLAFVRDEHPRVAAEAVRAIYDERVDAALPAVARLTDDAPEALRVEPVLRRAISANQLLGDAESAERLARLAASDLASEWRTLALDALLAWDQPLKREGVWGHWIDLPPRDESAARAAILAVLPSLTGTAATDAALAERIESARARFGENLSTDAMLAAIGDADAPPEYRRALLDRLAATAPGSVPEAARAALADPAPRAEPVRTRALALLAGHDPASAVDAIDHALTAGATRERQHAVSLLAALGTPPARDRLAALAAGLEDNTTDPAIALEVMEATTETPGDSHGAPSDLASGPGDPRLSPSALAAGGDPEAGAQLFNHHEAAQCLRCHTVGGAGGTAGPDLTTVASRLPPSTIIRSILEPAAEIAVGYGTIALRLDDGSVVGGVLLEDKPGAYILDSMGKRNSVPKDLVKSTIGPTSAMPDMTALLTPREIRDVIAYLATRQDPAIGIAPEPGRPQHDRADAAHSGPRFWAIFPGVLFLTLGAASLGLLVVALRIGSRAAAA